MEIGFNAMVEELKQENLPCVPAVWTESGKTIGLCFTTRPMFEMFHRYPELVRMDATLRVNMSGYLLYHVIVIDRHGHPHVVFCGFLSKENDKSLHWLLTEFRNIMGPAVEHIETVFLDQNLTHIQAWKKAFPSGDVNIMLCLSHIIKTVAREAHHLCASHVNEVVGCFKCSAFCDTKIGFTFYLLQIKQYSQTMYEYVESDWMPCRLMWAYYHRKSHFTLGGRTSNKIESLNELIKDVINQNFSVGGSVEKIKDVFFQQVENIEEKNEFDSSQFEEMVGIDKSLWSVLCMLSSYAAKKTMLNYKEHIEKEFSCSLSSACSCDFFRTWRMPCHHIIKSLIASQITPDAVLRVCRRWCDFGPLTGESAPTVVSALCEARETQQPRYLCVSHSSVSTNNQQIEPAQVIPTIDAL